ncbi:MAG: hypothetical protein HWN80_18350 [Candidatus Lokiarchaeota archaeon]|nr:hypothetical protein [Candidatus Lokiarchaeota archaeon]
MAIPNGYFSTNFTIPEPEFQISVGLSNKGILEITDFEVNVSLNLSYDYLPTNQNIYSNFFSKKINYGSIKGLSSLNYTIKSELSNFDVSILTLFWDNILNSSGVKFLMDVQIKCKFYFGLVPFILLVKDFDLFLIGCPTCP